MQCANPECLREVKYFRSGSLHYIDCSDFPSKGSRMERRLIWLCPDCSQEMAVESWRPAGEQIRVRHPQPVHSRKDGVAFTAA